MNANQIRGTNETRPKPERTEQRQTQFKGEDAGMHELKECSVEGHRCCYIAGVSHMNGKYRVERFWVVLSEDSRTVCEQGGQTRLVEPPSGDEPESSLLCKECKSARDDVANGLRKVLGKTSMDVVNLQAKPGEFTDAGWYLLHTGYASNDEFSNLLGTARTRLIRDMVNYFNKNEPEDLESQPEDSPSDASD